MKLINNMTDLSNEDIGRILDKLAKEIDTIYLGKVDCKYIRFPDKKIVINIYYKKRYVRFDIYEVKEW